MKKLLVTLSLGVLFATNSNAASMWINGPDIVFTELGFEVEIWGDFGSEGLLAGGINLRFDSARLAVDEIVLNLSNVEPDFSCPGNLSCPPGFTEPYGNEPIVWGAFTATLIAPDAGPTLMATVSFSVLDMLGLAAIDMTDSPGLAGGWFGAGGIPIAVPEFGFNNVVVLSSAIPLPAAVWFMIGALGTLTGFRRKQ